MKLVEHISKTLKDPFFGLPKKLVKITKKSYHPNTPEEILPTFGEVCELEGIRYLLVDSYRRLKIFWQKGSVWDINWYLQTENGNR